MLLPLSSTFTFWHTNPTVTSQHFLFSADVTEISNWSLTWVRLAQNVGKIRVFSCLISLNCVFVPFGANVTQFAPSPDLQETETLLLYLDRWRRDTSITVTSEPGGGACVDRGDKGVTVGHEVPGTRQLREGEFGNRIGSDWPQMGQMWDFLKSVSVHFGELVNLPSKLGQISLKWDKSGTF